VSTVDVTPLQGATAGSTVLGLVLR
jgi:hypothetical protein